MVYFKDAKTYTEQSTLLIKARPTTTRITTRYRLDPASSTSTDSTAPAPTRGYLVLKTYDPVSGVCLKYKTNRAQEVGRLIAISGRLARSMSGLPDEEEPEEEKVEETKVEEVKKEESKREEAKVDPKAGGGGAPGGGGGGGGGKKKKKGKK